MALVLVSKALGLLQRRFIFRYDGTQAEQWNQWWEDARERWAAARQRLSTTANSSNSDSDSDGYDSAESTANTFITASSNCSGSSSYFSVNSNCPYCIESSGSEVEALSLAQARIESLLESSNGLHLKNSELYNTIARLRHEATFYPTDSRPELCADCARRKAEFIQLEGLFDAMQAQREEQGQKFDKSQSLLLAAEEAFRIAQTERLRLEMKVGFVAAKFVEDPLPAKSQHKEVLKLGAALMGWDDPWDTKRDQASKVIVTSRSPERVADVRTRSEPPRGRTLKRKTSQRARRIANTTSTNLELVATAPTGSPISFTVESKPAGGMFTFPTIAQQVVANSDLEQDDGTNSSDTDTSDVDEDEDEDEGETIEEIERKEVSTESCNQQ
jgi:hypothetical protein